MLIPLLHVATSFATCNRGPILCKLDCGSVYTNKSTQLPPPRCAPAACSAAAVRAPATQQTQYLGESAETPETAATGLELPFPATTFRAANPPARSIGGCNLRPERCPASPTLRAQHIPAPSPLAQVSVRSLHSLQKERTRTLHVHMGVAASATARISPRTIGELSRASPIALHFAARALVPAPARPQHGKLATSAFPLVPPLP